MPSHQELMALGKKALGAGDAKAAIGALRSALEQKPEDPNTLLLLAQALERDEQLPQAQKAWLWCASRVRSPTMPLQRALAISLRRKNVEATHKLLSSITREYPALLTFKAQLARLELARGQVDACLELALALIDDALAANDVLHQAEGNLVAGLAFLLGSKPTYAEKHLMQARELKPDAVEPWLALASLRAHKKDRARAEQILSEAVRRFRRSSARRTTSRCSI
jgi:Tfp pilus assembly protein PilF